MARYKKHNHATRDRHVRKRKSTYWRSLWPVLAIGGLLLVGAIVLLTRGRQDQTSQQTDPISGTPQVTGAPRVAVSQDKLDYGNVRLGTTITSVFTVHNVGDRDLLILGEPAVQVVEGC